MFSSWNFCAPDLETSENKPHQIRVLELQAKECSRTSTVQVLNFKPDFDLDAAYISQTLKRKL